MSRRVLAVGAGFLAAVLSLAVPSATPSAAPEAQEPAASPAAPSPAAPLPAHRLSDAESEHFLTVARVVKTHSAGKGITNSLRATLTDGTLTHDAHIQTIEEAKTEFRGTQGTELNFKDSWAFNVSAYKLDRLIGMNMIPVTVARRYNTSRASYTWWVDDVMMDEGDRLKKKVSPPDTDAWNRQMQMVRLFDQLIYNVDRNLGNLLITRDWVLWPIDHTRAFRTMTTLKTPGNVARCDRKVFARLKELSRDTLKKEIGEFLQNWEIDGLLKRRDAIVAIIESRGDAGLFDLPPR
jgi:hypothetical protein